ncbi:MAG: hypothetical protein H0Z28_08430 [Archaeoglobus sp.]|nr:hypothetical protein [Archaeoglobus sp.]
MELPRFILQEPNLVEKPWGDEWIAEFKGIKDNRKIGESWEFSSHPSKPSIVIINGEKMNFLELLKIAGREIVGKDSESLPILVKLLDINSQISVQVHPSDEVARVLREKESGKDEAWLILEKGKVYIGFKEEVEPSQVSAPEVLDKMNKFEAEFLDSFRIPAGTIHFAEKVKLLEISSNSNITYRIYDFSGRAAQLDKALKALKMEITPVEEVKGEKGKVQMEKFGAEVVNISDTREFRIEGFNILLVLKGAAILESDGEVLELKSGQSCLIPAITKEYRIEGNKTLVCRIYALN